MPLIIYSKGTEDFASKLIKEYKNKDVVIGIGGGKAIDRAKILAGNKRCIAVPTTAAGACMTSHAVVFEDVKKSIKAKKPIYRKYEGKINLPKKVLNATRLDALSQAVESYWSINSTRESRKNSKLALEILNNSNKIEDIIHAGNLTGKAIEVTSTNIIHALSYPLTIHYGIPHGIACGVFLYPVISYFNFELEVRKFKVPKVEFDEELIIEKAMKYDKINQGPKINKQDLRNILKGGKIR